MIGTAQHSKLPPDSLQRVSPIRIAVLDVSVGLGSDACDILNYISEGLFGRKVFLKFEKILWFYKILLFWRAAVYLDTINLVVL